MTGGELAALKDGIEPATVFRKTILDMKRLLTGIMTYHEFISFKLLQSC